MLVTVRCGFTNNTRADLESHGNTKWGVLRKKAASAMEHLKSHVKEADVPIEHTDGSKSNLVQMEKKLEIELRGNIETELRRKIQREFEKQLKKNM